jgi:hypothetical protein
MTLLSVLHLQKDLLLLLGESALRSIVVAGVAGLVLTLLPSKRSIVQLRVWTGVLYIALTMPLLSVVLPHFNLAIPRLAWFAAHADHSAVLPATLATTVRDNYIASISAGSEVARASTIPLIVQKDHQQRTAKTAAHDSNPHSSVAVDPAVPAQQRASLIAWMSRVGWSGIALAIYFLGLVVLLARALAGIRGSRRLAIGASDISPRYFPRRGESKDPHTSAALDFLALQSQLAGLKVALHLKESSALLVPATVGIRKPLILLPPCWREWSREKLEAVLSHEISHVARRDALTLLLTRLHRALFWFSPLPWWLDRQITELAEQASDDAALAGGADRTLYAETLLGFFSQLEPGKGRVRWHALSMASYDRSGHPERRVDRILAWKPASSMKASFVVISLLCAVPVLLLIASLRPSVTAQAAAEPVKESGATVPLNTPTVPPSAIFSGTRAQVPAQGTPADQQKRARLNDDQKPADSSTTNVHGRFYHSGSGPRYVMIHADSNSVTMSGDEEDLQHARVLRDKITGDFIWFEHDEKSYVITDPAFLGRVQALFAPQEELGKQQDALGQQQDELGRQQDELGRQQDELGKRMDAVSVKIPDISPDLERIHGRLRQLQATGATQNELGSVQSQIGELQSRLGRLQSEAGQHQSVFGQQQSELGSKQSALGRKQGELGRQQGELGRRQAELDRNASSQLRTMFDDAIRNRIAKPE